MFTHFLISIPANKKYTYEKLIAKRTKRTSTSKRAEYNALNRDLESLKKSSESYWESSRDIVTCVSHRESELTNAILSLERDLEDNKGINVNDRIAKIDKTFVSLQNALSEERPKVKNLPDELNYYLALDQSLNTSMPVVASASTYNNVVVNKLEIGGKVKINNNSILNNELNKQVNLNKAVLLNEYKKTLGDITYTYKIGISEGTFFAGKEIKQGNNSKVFVKTSTNKNIQEYYNIFKNPNSGSYIADLWFDGLISNDILNKIKEEQQSKNSLGIYSQDKNSGNGFIIGNVSGDFSQKPSKEVIEKSVQYLEQSLDQIVLGDYIDSFTLLGTAGQITFGFTGLDVPMDIRDISNALANWDNSFKHVSYTAFLLICLLPFIGSLKPGSKLFDALNPHLEKIPELVEKLKQSDNTIINGLKNTWVGAGMVADKALEKAKGFWGKMKDAFDNMTKKVVRNNDISKVIEEAELEIKNSKQKFISDNETKIKNLINSNVKVQDKFRLNLDNIQKTLQGKNINIKLKNADPKSAESITEKAIGNGSKINLKDFTDIIRSRYIIDKEKDVDEIIKEIKNKFGTANVEIKNKFEKVKSTGFRDITLNITIDGEIIELQIVPKELNDINDVTHKLYEEKRRLELVQNKFPEIKAEISRIDDRLNKLNNDAWESFKKRQ